MRILTLSLTTLLFSTGMMKPTTLAGSLPFMSRISKTNTGQLILDIYPSEEGYPNETEHSIKRMKTKIVNGTGTFQVNGLQIGITHFE